MQVASGRLQEHLSKGLRSLYCLHGDEPTAVNVARHVRKGLEAAGCRIVTIPEMLN